MIDIIELTAAPDGGTGLLIGLDAIRGGIAYRDPASNLSMHTGALCAFEGACIARRADKSLAWYQADLF